MIFQMRYKMNKKQLEKQGYAFKKIGKIEYLDLSAPREKKILNCPMTGCLKIEQQLRNHFIKKSKKKGKALSIVLPLVNQGQMTELLSELYDLRETDEQRKIEEKIQRFICKDITEVFNNPEALKTLRSLVETAYKQKKKSVKSKKPKSIKGGHKKK